MIICVVFFIKDRLWLTCLSRCRFGCRLCRAEMKLSRARHHHHCRIFNGDGERFYFILKMVPRDDASPRLHGYQSTALKLYFTPSLNTGLLSIFPRPSKFHVVRFFESASRISSVPSLDMHWFVSASRSFFPRFGPL